MLNKSLSVRAQNERMTCQPDGFFRTSSRQPVQPYIRQIANAFAIGLLQRGRTVVQKRRYSHE